MTSSHDVRAHSFTIIDRSDNARVRYLRLMCNCLTASGRLSAMRMSTRNQLRGTVSSVQLGEVMAAVKVALPDGQTITASITREASEDLGLEQGDEVTVLIKSTEVMLGKE
jgi:molybdate transport system regulatory protein